MKGGIAYPIRETRHTVGIRLMFTNYSIIAGCLIVKY